jgi:hypothetical protein
MHWRRRVGPDVGDDGLADRWSSRRGLLWFDRRRWTSRW